LEQSWKVGWQDIAESEQVEAADWIRDRMRTFAENVGSVVPPGFLAYARIFHPASLASRALEDPEVEVRWAEVAAWNDKIVHPEMQFHRLGGPWMGAPQERGPRVYEPRTGAITLGIGAALVEVLTRHTSTPDSCWLCLWDGYGDLHPGGSFTFTAFRVGDDPPPPLPPPKYPRQKNRVRLPARDYLLFHGAVGDAHGWSQGPNLWWPDDRAWCVATEIDFPYTYVGGSAEAIEELLARPDLEALPASITDGITAVSDTNNP
jgi:hypothetical protein